MSGTARFLVNKPGEGRTIAVVGDVYRFLATGEDTNGKYALWEAVGPPGGGPPPHVHRREEEGFYVLEGEITFLIGDQRLAASAGVFANMPVGTPHSFKNESGQPAKMLISVAPAGLEQMFFEVGVPVPPGAATAAPPTEEEIERLLAAAARYGSEIKLRAHCRSRNGKISQNWQESAPENRRERQTLPLRRVPQEKPETRQDSGTLVLPELSEATRLVG